MSKQAYRFDVRYQAIPVAMEGRSTGRVVNMLLIPLPVWALKHVDLGNVEFRFGTTMVNNSKANSKRVSSPSQTIGGREENREKEKMFELY